ncbi:formylglycine-generating enzyme family protein [Novosphingobium aquae]|uniref:Formylglycine-generating enzyme family protein n=1 Tax=Novosphingobium aquae TaxID=3133435 RepID=A0ABU8SA63_9SPHN
MVFVKGGTFTMGAQPENREEGPPQKVSVGSFWIDSTEVTNAQFAAFVKATGYVTMAEKPLDPAVYPTVAKEDLAPSSLVFTQPQGQVDLRDPSQWWQVVKGADWRHPAGPGSSIEGKADYPVVQIAYQDALAYAQWAGRDLPTEAEWEFAARGGLEGKRFSWGDSAPDGRSGNMWQGPFPVADEGTDGYRAQLAPVGCFQKNGLGLSDMAGNVWEWTNTWFRPNISSNGGKASIPPESDALDPDEPGVAKHVAKGGSFLCADNYCLRYRPSARTPGPPDTGSSHIGFRTVKRTS